MALAIATFYMDKKQKKALLKDNIEISLYMYLSLFKAKCTRWESWKILKNVHSGMWYFQYWNKVMKQDWEMLWGTWKYLNCVWSYQNRDPRRNISSQVMTELITIPEFQVKIWIWYWCNGDTVCAAGRAANIMSACGHTDKDAALAYTGI